MFRSPDTARSPVTDAPVEVSVNLVASCLCKLKSPLYDVILFDMCDVRLLK